PLHHIIAVERGQRNTKILWYPVVAVAMFVGNLAYLVAVSGEHALKELLFAFADRTNLLSGDGKYGEGEQGMPVFGLYAKMIVPIFAGWRAFVQIWIDRAHLMFTTPALILAAAGMFDIMWQRKDQEIFSDRWLP